MSERISEQIIENIDDKYINEAIKYTSVSQRKLHRTQRRSLRAVACLAAALAISFSSICIATAAGNMTAYDMLYSLHPTIASKLVPVNESCEDQGIRMEVESVFVHDNSADIYISMQDLTGDRVDETIDLFDSYNIHTNADQIGGCSLVDYDAGSKKAAFLISVEQMDGKRIDGSRMWFSVARFLSGKCEQNVEISDISLENVQVVTDTQGEANIRGYAVSEDNDFSEENLPALLFPDEQQEISLLDQITVTAYGFIDGQLHVQVYYKDIGYDNHGYIYLKDSKGNEINNTVSIAFWDDGQKGSYEEYVFDVGPDTDLSNYTVWGDFTTCETLTEGNWEVSFPIKNKQ